MRTEESNRADIQAFFGEDGFVCSAAAHDLIKAAGFDQLAGAALGGDCGKVLNAGSSNFTAQHGHHPDRARSPAPARPRRTTSPRRSPRTRPPSAPSPSPRAPRVLARDVSIVSGRAVTPPLKLDRGQPRRQGRLHPGPVELRRRGEHHDGRRQGPAVVKTKPAIAESFPAKVKLKKKAKTAVVKGTVTVKGATGKVDIKKGAKVLKSATLKGGKAKITLPKLKKGTYKLTIAYAGDAKHLAGTKTFTIKVVK